MIAEVLAELAPLAYAAGLTPSEFRASTVGEVVDVLEAHRRRQARELDAMAWTVAHLLVGGGTLRKGTRVDQLMRELLGREPGTVPGEAPPADESEPAADPRTLSPAASIAYMAAWVRARAGKGA